MGHPAHRPATYADLLDLPEHLVGEIINGELVSHPRPASRHTLAATSLGGELDGPFHKGRGGPGGWWILDEPELHLGPHVLVPDLAGWRRERMPTFPDTAWFESAPDWVCEVLSPTTARLDRGEKLPIYAASGVAHIWLVDPILRTLEAFEIHNGKWLLLAVFKNDEAVSIAPFGAISFGLAALWAD
jgi:Uma2 family endonuclease